MRRTLHEDVFTFMIIYRPILLRMRNVSNKSCRENQNTHFMSNNFFRKLCRLRDNVEKCGGTREAAECQYGGALRAGLVKPHARARAPTHTKHARTRVQACARTHTHNIDSFSTAAIISWTGLNIMLYVHCLTCSFMCRCFRKRCLTQGRQRIVVKHRNGSLHCVIIYIYMEA